MRTPHYLVRHRSGVWHFRLRVPRSLWTVLGVSVIKRSLGTCDVLRARATAYVLGLRYAAYFAAAREAAMPKPPPPSVADILANVGAGRTHDWTLERDPASGMLTKITTDGSAQDNAGALDAMRIVFASALPPARPSAPPEAVPAGIVANSLSAATSTYLATLKGRIPAKTLTQKRAAIESFAKYKGPKVDVHTVSRTDVSQWLDSLRTSGLTTSTLENKCAYLKGFFTWAQGAGHYPVGEERNPSTKHIQRGKNEKRQRRKHGFKALTLEQVRKLYAPEVLAGTNTQTRWGALVGLYTGARVGEVGQLALGDFFDDDGVWSMNITDEGVGQSVKNEASVRTIPVHPDLVHLGLRERVDALLARGETQLFPRAKAGSVNGMGNWLSKAFGRLLAEQEIRVPVGKVGFHSLRKTVIQALKDLGVREEARKEYVGHENAGEHHEVYGKIFSARQLLHGVASGPFQTAGVEGLTFGLDLDGVGAALTAPDPPRKKKGRK